MEREYVVSFILILAVIVIIGAIAYVYYPKVFDDVSSIAKDVFKFGQKEKNIKSTQYVVESILSSLEFCQGQDSVACSCEIKNKKPMAKDYKIFFKLVPGASGKTDMLIYAFSDQDEIIPIKLDAKGLKLDNLKIGIAYWANCPECGDDKAYGDIYCIFSSELAGKDAPMIIKGDAQQDWAFSYYNAQGVTFDQLSSKSEYSKLSRIGNMIKFDDNRYCFVTTNLLRPGDDSKFRPITLKKTDDFVKIMEASKNDQTSLTSRGAVSSNLRIGFQWPPIWIAKEGRALPDMNKVQALDKLKFNFGSCELLKKSVDAWRSSIKDEDTIDAETKEMLRPFSWPIAASGEMKVVCDSKTVNGKPVSWLDRIKAPINSPVLASTDGEVSEVCDENCLPGKKYVILKDKVETNSRTVQSSDYSVNDQGIIVNQAGELKLQNDISVIIYLGNLNTINKQKVAVGSKVLMGDVIGALGNPLDRNGPWLDYRVAYTDTGTPATGQYFNYLISAVKQQNYNIAVYPDFVKDRKVIFAREFSPYASLHAGGIKLAKTFYENCDNPSTPNNELDGAITLEANFGQSYRRTDFTYEDPNWKDSIKTAQASNPRSYRNI